jgi:hypothetical protein
LEERPDAGTMILTRLGKSCGAGSLLESLGIQRIRVVMRHESITVAEIFCGGVS